MSVEEPELDSSFTGRFLVELFARQKGREPAEKMIHKKGKNPIMTATIITTVIAAATAKPFWRKRFIKNEDNTELTFESGEVI